MRFLSCHWFYILHCPAVSRQWIWISELFILYYFGTFFPTYTHHISATMLVIFFVSRKTSRLCVFMFPYSRRFEGRCLRMAMQSKNDHKCISLVSLPSSLSIPREAERLQGLFGWHVSLVRLTIAPLTDGGLCTLESVATYHGSEISPSPCRVFINTRRCPWCWGSRHIYNCEEREDHGDTLLPKIFLLYFIHH